jgi:hypothetical protein
MRTRLFDEQTQQPQAYYQQEGESYLIEIKLGNIDQLFNSMDPSPFREKDLDPEAEAYLVNAVREFSLSTPLKLRIYLTQAMIDEDSPGVVSAIQRYFEYRSHAVTQELRFLLRRGRTALVVGLLFLGFCMGLRELISLIGQGVVAQVLEEGLLIIGWVAMWRPIEIFLYDWWPIFQQRQVFKKLSRVPVQILGHSPTTES